MSTGGDEITTAIERRLGYVPSYFEPARDNPRLLAQLWGECLAGYHDNPLPALFKEKLLAYLARYCSSPYGLVCHCCALAGLGLSGRQVLALLETPVPAEDEVEAALGLIGGEPTSAGRFPVPGSALEEAVFAVAVYFFLNRDRAARCRAALRRLLGEHAYGDLMALLAYAKASHVWAEGHPELSYGADRPVGEALPALIAGEPRLADFFTGYRERTRREYRRLEERLVADLDRQRSVEEQLRRQMDQLQTVYQLHNAVSRAAALDEIYREALDGLARCLGVERASILLIDPDGVMRFKAWRGLSDDYRRAVEGHSPWTRETPDPQPILVPDAERDEHLAALLPVLRAESVRALAFIPLLDERRLLGKFMLYYEQPHAFTGEELQLARNVGSHISFAIARHQAERERAELLAREQAARAQAEAASRAKDDFLATISHELRTPLTAILAWPLILRGKLDDPDAVGRGLEVIERNAKLQAQIIEDLLEVSRIITGKMRLDPRPTPLTPILESAVDAVRSAAEAKGIILKTLVDEAVGQVYADPDRLQQILWNLLSNAIKFTPQGGRVEVRLKRGRTGVEIAVADDGIGISPEFLPHVFERFRQADSSTSRRHGGLGLGLSIVRHLVELHGGTVRADSAGAGQGATFTLELPVLEARGAAALERRPAALEQVPHAVGGEGLAGLRLLVVDDEPDTLEMLTAALAGFGAEVKGSSSAAEALAALPGWGADVLVSDIGMPGEDGYALIRRVRALPPEQGGNTPAAALTAFARTEDRVRALSAGFQIHVPKPVEPVELVAVVQNLARQTGKL
jgi:signal transduction histidine kinase